MAARNSLKHGLLAKSAVIMQGPAKENKAEFAKLLSGLHDYFNPVGTAEDLLVQEIAISYWMERRAQIYENLEICIQVLTLRVKPSLRESGGGMSEKISAVLPYCLIPRRLRFYNATPLITRSDDPEPWHSSTHYRDKGVERKFPPPSICN
jgi:hypothetical protein